MAFCPNCGTPNTEQAVRCVSCGTDLIPSKQKGKFKGTIIMAPVQIAQAAAQSSPPSQPAPAQPSSSAPPAAPAAPVPAPSAKAGNFQKTMMGRPGSLPPLRAPVIPSPSSDTGPMGVEDLGRAPTLQGELPVPAHVQAATPGVVPQAPTAQSYEAPPAFEASHSPASAEATAPTMQAQSTGSGFSSGGYGSAQGYGGTDSFGNLPNVAPKTNTNKIIAVGCGAMLVVGVGLAALLYKKGSEVFGESQSDEAAALEWKASVGQALTQVSTLCPDNCASAAVYFHQDVQEALMPEAKQLTAARVQKLIEDEASQAQMLDDTDDKGVAEKLQLDATQCVRVVSGAAKVVACSVPTPGGQPSLRIVDLTGVGSL